MKITLTLRHAAIIGIAFLPIFVNAENKITNRIKVQLTVPPAFNVFEDEAKSYLMRELRELGDVEIVTKGKGDYFVSVLPAPIRPNDSITGIAMSYVFEEESTGSIVHNVNFGPPEHLKQMCQKVIAQLDTAYLEERRRKINR